MIKRASKHICRIVAISLLLFIPTGFARGAGITLSLNCDKNIAFAGDAVTFTVTMTNKTDIPYLVVWNYPNSKNIPSSMLCRSSDQTTDGKVMKRGIIVIPDSPPEKKPIINLISTFRVFLDDTLLGDNTSWVLDETKPIRRGVLHNVLCLLPGMYISQPFVLRNCAEVNPKETPCLSTGKHKIRVEYTLTSDEVFYCQKLLKVQKLLLEYPLVPAANFFSGTIRSNELTVELKDNSTK
jgi:hypothetical protein